MTEVEDMTIPAPVSQTPPDAPAPASVDPSPSASVQREPELEVYRDVPNFDPRTLVLKKGDNFLDLQFCSCVNKYKRRFSAFLQENRSLYEDVKSTAASLAENGYKDVDVRDILGHLRVVAKANSPAKRYLLDHAHDFDLDALQRAYLVRKLMMETPELFGFFELNQVKCRSGCGYGHTDEPPPVKEDETDIAGF